MLRAANEVKGGVEVWPHSVNMSRYLKVIEEVDVFIGEKLHSVVGAVCAYKPSIMLAYQPKCIDFMKSLGLEDYVLRTDHLDLDQLLQTIELIQGSYESYRNHLYRRVSDLKLVQRQVASEIAKSILQ